MLRCACAVFPCMSKMSMRVKKTEIELILLGFFAEGYLLPLHEENKIISCKHETKKENRTSPHRVFFQYFKIQGCRRLMEVNSVAWFFSVR